MERNEYPQTEYFAMDIMRIFVRNIFVLGGSSGSFGETALSELNSLKLHIMLFPTGNMSPHEWDVIPVAGQLVKEIQSKESQLGGKISPTEICGLLDKIVLKQNPIVKAGDPPLSRFL